MSRAGNQDRKRYGCVWEDCRPWVEQLYAQHGLQTRLEVVLPADRHGISSAVVLNLSRSGPGQVVQLLYTDYLIYEPRHEGAAESAALKLISKALLHYDNLQAMSLPQQADLWGK